MISHQDLEAAIMEAINKLGGKYRWLYLGAVAKRANEILGQPALDYYGTAELCRRMANRGDLVSEYRTHRGSRLSFCRLTYKLSDTEKLILELVKEAGGDKRWVMVYEILKAAKQHGIILKGYSVGHAMRPLVRFGLLEKHVRGSPHVSWNRRRCYRLPSTDPKPQLEEVVLDTMVQLNGRARFIRPPELVKALVDLHQINVGSYLLGQTLGNLTKAGKLEGKGNRNWRSYKLPSREKTPDTAYLILEALSSLKASSGERDFGSDEIADQIDRQSAIRLTPYTIGRTAGKLAREGRLKARIGPQRRFYKLA